MTTTDDTQNEAISPNLIALLTDQTNAILGDEEQRMLEQMAARSSNLRSLDPAMPMLSVMA